MDRVKVEISSAHRRRGEGWKYTLAKKRIKVDATHSEKWTRALIWHFSGFTFHVSSIHVLRQSSLDMLTDLAHHARLPCLTIIVLLAAAVT